MNHCNDFAPCGPPIGQYNSYSYFGLFAKIKPMFIFIKH